MASPQTEKTDIDKRLYYTNNVSRKGYSTLWEGGTWGNTGVGQGGMNHRQELAEVFMGKSDRVGKFRIS